MKPQAQFEAELSKAQPNILVVGEYVGANRRVSCKCKNCNSEWDGIPTYMLRKITGCPTCNASKGEAEVAKYLTENHYTYKRQHMFNGCVYEEKLRFDFYLPDINTAIEFQGEQHYYPVDFSGKGKENANAEYEYCQVRDNIKREYCSQHEIQLIEIPYNERDNGTIYEYLNQALKNARQNAQRLRGLHGNMEAEVVPGEIR